MDCRKINSQNTMVSFSSKPILTCIFVLAVSMSQAYEVTGSPVQIPLCKMGFFYNSTNGRCIFCSPCPVNQIIHQPCTASDDTVCGPFYEFEFFNKGNGNQNGGNVNKEEVKISIEEGREFNLFKIESSQGSTQNGKAPTNEIVDTNGPSMHNAAMKWKELCYGLIAALVVLAVVFAIYVVVAQIHMSKLHKRAKAASIEGGPEETVYCYTQQYSVDVSSPSGSPALPPIKHNNPRLSTTDMNRHRLLHPIYKPGQARRFPNNIPSSVRASPNDYIIQNGSNASASGQPCRLPQELSSLLGNEGDKTHQSNQQALSSSSSSGLLLPVIPESSNDGDCDHVRVLYTS